MAKQGMARPDWTKLHPKNDPAAVSLIQGKAKTGKAKAKPIIAGTEGPEMKVYHEGGSAASQCVTDTGEKPTHPDCAR